MRLSKLVSALFRKQHGIIVADQLMIDSTIHQLHEPLSRPEYPFNNPLASSLAIFSPGRDGLESDMVAFKTMPRSNLSGLHPPMPITSSARLKQRKGRQVKSLPDGCWNETADVLRSMVGEWGYELGNQGSNLARGFSGLALISIIWNVCYSG